MGAALVVHALLIVALTAGIQWKQDNSLSVEAELWSAVPMAAAPKLVEVETPPPPPAPKPEPAPKGGASTSTNLGAAAMGTADHNSASTDKLLSCFH